MQKHSSSAGFAVVEFLLVVIIIGLLAGVTAYVVTQKHNSEAVLNAATNAESTHSTKAAQGTTESVQSTESESAQAEATASESTDTATSQAATSDQSSLNSMGGTYDESQL